MQIRRGVPDALSQEAQEIELSPSWGPLRVGVPQLHSQMTPSMMQTQTLVGVGEATLARATCLLQPKDSDVCIVPGAV